MCSTKNVIYECICVLYILNYILSKTNYDKRISNKNVTLLNYFNLLLLSDSVFKA